MKRFQAPARVLPHGTRRHFLHGTLALSAGLLSGLACSPRPTPGNGGSTPGQLGVALLGLGNYAETQLAPALRLTRACALRGIVTGSPDKIAPWQARYGIADRHVYDYMSLPRIADDGAIDVVYVVVPTALHAKYTIMAAQAGKHVWCEKPMAMDTRECQAMIDACRANGVSLTVGYRMQHEPNTRTVIGFARDKPYGAIRSIRAVVGDRTDGEPSWRMQRAMGGGALYDLGIYAINAIRYASGEEPVQVLRARQWSERAALFREVDECSEFELALPSGATAYGKGSRNDDQNALRVEAERGAYWLAPMQAYSGVVGGTSDGKALALPVDKQQARQMDDDAQAILDRRAPQTPGEEGLRDIQILEAIQRAAQSGEATPIPARGEA